MSLSQQIDKDLKEAMTSKNETKVSTLRLLKSAVKYAAIEKKAQGLSDAEIVQVIQKQMKQRRESIEQFSKGDRPELADKERKEVEILESYLPKQLSDGELEAHVKACVKEAGAASKKDFGRVMKVLTEKLAGQAEPRRISELVGRILQ